MSFIVSLISLSKMFGSRLFKTISAIQSLENNNGLIEHLPDKFEGSYDYTYNIDYINHVIIQRFKREKEGRLNNLTQEIKKINQELQSPLQIVDIRWRQNRLKELHEKYDIISTGKDHDEYLHRVTPILERDKTIDRSIFISKGFGQKKFLDPEEKRRLQIIDEFLVVARDYITIDLVQESFVDMSCQNCGKEVPEISPTIDGLEICPYCCVERSIYSTKIPNESTRLSNETTVDNHSHQTFARVFRRFNGIDCIPYTEETKEKLDKYFTSIGRNIGDEVKLRPFDGSDRGRKVGTSAAEMHAAFRACKLSIYDDCNYIMHNYWGWKLPETMPYFETVMHIYRTLQPIYMRLQKEGRKSSLGNQWVIYKILQMLGYPVYIVDFKTAKNPDSIRFHKECWAQMCRLANDPLIRDIIDES